MIEYPSLLSEHLPGHRHRLKKGFVPGSLRFHQEQPQFLAVL